MITAVQRRTFIAIDEWLGVLLLLYLWKTDDQLFWPALVLWGIAVYVISYPLHWWKESRERRPKIPSPQPTREIGFDQYPR